jgi:hypothetical protein
MHIPRWHSQRLFSSKKGIKSFISGYTECNWKVQTNYGHKFHIPNQGKMSISTLVQKHLICELQLMHHCAPAHFSHAVQYALNNAYHDWWTHCMASTHATYESSGCLPVETPKNPCACSFCWHWRDTLPLHFECLPDYPQVPRHLETDTMVHD